MTAVSTVLLAVATELAKTAKDSMPKIREGENVISEWLENGIYNRKTTLNGDVYLAQYDFRQKKSRRVAVVDRIGDV
ncbi:MAG: hypothetical protein OSJ43_12460 [Oscillospiraceae bacterium]|nr:hypothetical protein [Oscillospiraceae bacterium]